MSFFSVQGLTKRFGGLTALDDVSFEVEKGSIFSAIFAYCKAMNRGISRCYFH